MTIRIYHLAFGIAALAAVAGLWIFLAPPELGGGTTYSITRGTSMSPSFKNGDLVVMRRSDHYSVGDIAAYRNRDFNRVVMHRIIGRAGNDYVFKGDHNNYVDSARVARADVVGRLWFHLPGGGSMLSSAWTPSRSIPVVLGGLLLLLVLRWSLRKMRHSFGNARARITGTGAMDTDARDGIFRSRRNTFLLGALSGVFGVAFLFALMLPANRHSAPQTYEQRGSFSYSATPDAPAGVYPNGRVSTGDPIFLRIVRDLRVAYDYDFRSIAAHRVEGTASLRAVLQSPEGWKHELVLQSPKAFHGDSAAIAGTLRLDRLRTLIDRFQAATGVPNATYTLTVSPLVVMRGSAGHTHIADRFATPLLFQLDALELRVLPPQTIGSGRPPDPYVATRAAALPTTTMPVQAGPFSSSVVQLRVFALLACLLTALAAAACALPSLREKRGRADLASVFGDRLIDVASTRRVLSRRSVVEVPDALSLVHLADGIESPILHDVDEDVYLLEGDGFIYRYAPAGHGTLHVVGADDAHPESAPLGSPVGDAAA